MTQLNKITPLINQYLEKLIPEFVSIRRDLHANPELGYDEKRTSKVIQDFLKTNNIKFASGLAKGTGVLGHLPGANTEAIALRADIDALPILEENSFDWKSVNKGCMHACGHDGHTAILLGAAKVLSLIAKEHELPNPVSFVFQPAEEGGGGGEQMVLDGCLDGSVLGPKVKMMFGLHGWPQLELGHVATRIGPMLAADIGIEVTIQGIGGHAAFPYLCDDPIICGAQIVSSLQQIASRNTDPLDSLVVSITQFHAGTTHNIIPEEVKLSGTIRYLQQETGAMAKERFIEIVENVAKAHRCKAEIRLHDGYPVTKNHPDATEKFFEVANKTIDSKMVSEFEKPVMGGEDFSYYCQEVPSCFFALGLLPKGAQEMAALHQPTFDFNDEALATGIRIFCALALQS